MSAVLCIMPHDSGPPRVVLSAVLFMALVFAASQSFAAGFSVARSNFGQTVVARCPGDAWTNVAYNDDIQFYFDCSGTSL